MGSMGKHPARAINLKPSIGVNPIKLETGLRPKSAGMPYTLLLRIEAMAFPTFRLLLHSLSRNLPERSPARKSGTALL